MREVELGAASQGASTTTASWSNPARVCDAPQAQLMRNQPRKNPLVSGAHIERPVRDSAPVEMSASFNCEGRCPESRVSPGRRSGIRLHELLDQCDQRVGYVLLTIVTGTRQPDHRSRRPHALEVGNRGGFRQGSRLNDSGADGFLATTVVRARSRSAPRGQCRTGWSTRHAKMAQLPFASSCCPVDTVCHLGLIVFMSSLRMQRSAGPGRRAGDT